MQRVLITPGEPAGIGPDITIHMAQYDWPVELIVIADPDLLAERAKTMGMHLELITFDPKNNVQKPHVKGTLKIIPIALKQAVRAGQLNKANAPYVIATLEQAAFLCQNKDAHAIVTGPVHKGIINEACIPFSGHTEFFADYCRIPHTVMLFVVDKMKVALATTHLPLSAVPAAITKERLHSTLSILNTQLKQLFHIKTPKIYVCGLNPHAGESGHLGREEMDIITPVLDTLRTEKYQLEGPLPADTIFTAKYLEDADAVLAMYHDQALPLVKYAGFGHAVNVTLGLPFIRTSVDHGTALDIVATKAVDPGSMKAALELAIKLVPSPFQQHRHC